MAESARQDGAIIATDPPQSAEPAPRNRGWFKAGNVTRVSHGLYSERDLAGLQEQVNAFLDASVADDGGQGEVGARRLAQHTYRARLHRRIVQLDNALEVRGMFDQRGKLRVAWLQRLEGLIATARAIDNQLGLARKAPATEPSLSVILRGEAE